MGGGGRLFGGVSGEEVVRASVPERWPRSYCAEDSAAAQNSPAAADKGAARRAAARAAREAAGIAPGGARSSAWSGAAPAARGKGGVVAGCG
ncbi:UNVERIFIED_CONTAM: hypothetical protein Sangu_2092900 [Sesamum angustifolium]|uniref:Uncharacterized protein n=1 Tax=Sesamum angustifolium TaxID=2727405 RepID=A0AAW2LJB2_9LAMI